MPPGTLTGWSLSPSYDALERNPEDPLPRSESDALHWQDVEAEPPGFVVLPLKKGGNELMLAVSELGGGWGFICRLADLKN